MHDTQDTQNSQTYQSTHNMPNSPASTMPTPTAPGMGAPPYRDMVEPRYSRGRKSRGRGLRKTTGWYYTHP